jgi:restriction system protein
VSVLLSVTAFIVLRFVVPLFIPSRPATSSNYALKGILGAAPGVAPFVALVLLLPAPVAAFRQWYERRLLEKQDGLASIRTLSWSRFETLVAEAYRRQGYTVSRPSANGPDGGVDLVLRKDGNTLLVQCKQWKVWKVGVKVIREMYGVLTDRKAHGVVVVTSGMFTQEARTPRPPSSPPVPRAAAQPATQGPAKEPDSGQKRCPQCGHPMILRTAQRGSQAGQQFWGCSQFPRCRATAPNA